MQFSKVANFLLPTDEKQPTELEKSLSLLITRGLNPAKRDTDKNHRRDSSIGGKIVDVIRWSLLIRWAIF